MHNKRFICLLFLILLMGCGTNGSSTGTAMQSYQDALAETDPKKRPVLAPGSEAEKRALAGFSNFFSAFSTATLERDFDALYARNAYFYDGIKDLRGKDRIKSYFRETLAAIQDAMIVIDDVAISGGNYYFRWRMDFALKRAPEDPIRALGVTHLRFDTQGRIIFQHDFWDTSVIFEKLPVLGTLMQWIKKKI